jgi:hypothetical protein
MSPINALAKTELPGSNHAVAEGKPCKREREDY